FDFSLDEIADALETTTGAVKAALHRGRGKLAEPEPAHRAPVVPAVLDAFCRAFDARDLAGLTALLLETATLGSRGFKIAVGRDEIRRSALTGTLFGCPDIEHPLPIATPHCELRAHRGETIMLWWSGDEVHAIVRAELDGDRIARLRNYYHCP